MKSLFFLIIFFFSGLIGAEEKPAKESTEKSTEKSSNDSRFSEETVEYFLKGKRKADIKLQSKDVMLAVFIFKSKEGDGYHGILFKKGGKEVLGSDEVLDFQNFKLSYYGPYTERDFTYSRSGWLPQNLSVLRTRMVKSSGRKGVTLENKY